MQLTKCCIHQAVSPGDSRSAAEELPTAQVLVSLIICASLLLLSPSQPGSCLRAVILVSLRPPPTSSSSLLSAFVSLPELNLERSNEPSAFLCPLRLSSSDLMKPVSSASRSGLNERMQNVVRLRHWIAWVQIVTGHRANVRSLRSEGRLR